MAQSAEEVSSGGSPCAMEVADSGFLERRWWLTVDLPGRRWWHEELAGEDPSSTVSHVVGAS
jgi:hypothetical protein